MSSSPGWWRCLASCRCAKPSTPNALKGCTIPRNLRVSLLERRDERGSDITIGNRERTEDQNELSGDANDPRPMHAPQSNKIVQHESQRQAY